MLTVKQLIEKLYSLNNDDAMVILPSDSGSRYLSTIDYIGNGFVGISDQTGSLEISDEEDPTAKNAVFIWPKS